MRWYFVSFISVFYRYSIIIMVSSMVKLVKAERIIQSLYDVMQHEKPTNVINQQVNSKAYYNQGQTLEERTEGLNRTAQLRTNVFHVNKDNPDNSELTSFIEYLRLNDKRLLNMIFYLAGIKNNQHQLGFDQFNKEDKQAIITAINKIKALAALLPKHIAMPI